MPCVSGERAGTCGGRSWGPPSPNPPPRAGCTVPCAACAALSSWSRFGAKEIKGANIFGAGDKTDFSSSCTLHTPCTYSTNI